MYNGRLCKECGLGIKDYEDSCPRCGGSEIGIAEYKLRPVHPDRIKEYLEKAFSLADGMLKSSQVCPWCKGEKHWLVFPARRDPEKYSKLLQLTTLPFCPRRVWQHSKEIGKSLPEIMQWCSIEG